MSASISFSVVSLTRFPFAKIALSSRPIIQKRKKKVLNILDFKDTGDLKDKIEDIREDEAQELQEKVAAKYPDCEVTVANGGQPVYYYLVSLE